MPAETDLHLFLDLAPNTDSMASEVLEGLSTTPKSLPSKYFYDSEGSRLFDLICELEEYYPTRTELGIMESVVPELAQRFADDMVLLEYGSGSSLKTRLLLEQLPGMVSYVPIDISGEHLLEAGRSLQERFPSLEILPVCADYGQRIPFPWDALELSHLRDAQRMVYFPGSTIGNFTHPVATAFLRRMASLVGPGGHVLLGADLVKDVGVLEAAYDDARGVTAAFNRNILHHINRRLGCDFDPDAFDHRAFYDPSEQRIEMHLVARQEMTVRVLDRDFHFAQEETIRTEYSHKYRLEDVVRMADEAGLDVETVWTDERAWFSVQLLRAR